MEYPCLYCLHVYDSADDVPTLRCRISGLRTSPALAQDCRRFVEDFRTDDDRTALLDECDWLGRGD